jgi:biotin carboxyl carrier protein
MDFEFLIDKHKDKITVESGKGMFRVIGPDGAQDLDVQRISDNCLSLLAGGRSHQVFFARDKGRLLLWVDGDQFLVQEPSEEAGSRRAEEASREGLWRIAAPMPGKVIKFSVAEGDKVRKNQTLAVVEAMKMENELKSPGDGTVKKIHASPGDMVDTSKPLLEIESG